MSICTTFPKYPTLLVCPYIQTDCMAPYCNKGHLIKGFNTSITLAGVAMASNKKPSIKNALVVATVVLLLATPSRAETLSLIDRWTARMSRSLFPQVEVTLFNESEEKVLYMCSFGAEDERSLRVLEGGQQNSWNFTQFAFPLHWCYLYVNEKRHGFFWAYGVRSRCIKCFWKVGKYPFLYRNDRNRWERQQLFPPQNLKFNLTVPGGATS